MMMDVGSFSTMFLGLAFGAIFVGLLVAVAISKWVSMSWSVTISIGLALSWLLYGAASFAFL